MKSLSVPLHTNHMDNHIKIYIYVESIQSKEGKLQWRKFSIIKKRFVDGNFNILSTYCKNLNLKHFFFSSINKSSKEQQHYTTHIIICVYYINHGKCSTVQFYAVIWWLQNQRNGVTSWSTTTGVTTGWEVLLNMAGPICNMFLFWPVTRRTRHHKAIEGANNKLK